MSKIVFILLSLVLVVGCNKTSNTTESSKMQDSIIEPISEKVKDDSISIKSDRKLRFLFYSNGGLIGYFDDGTVSGCPRCDLLDANIDALYDEKPFATYSFQNKTIIQNGEQLEPYAQIASGAEGWAMVDYKWVVEPDKIKKD